MKHCLQARSVAQQAARGDILPRIVDGRYCVPRFQVAELLAQVKKNWIWNYQQRIRLRLTKFGESHVEFLFIAGWHNNGFQSLPTRCHPCFRHVRFCICVIRIDQKLTTPAFGSSSRNNSIRFGPNWLAMRVTPVTFAPGRLRLSTSPIATGSLAVMKTIGIVAVAPFAIKVGTSLIVKITSVRSRTRPSVSAGTRSRWVSAQRYSMATSRPSLKPAAAIPSRNAAVNSGGVAAAYPGPRNPTARTFGCSERAASGHATAPAPITLTKSRRRIAAPHRTAKAIPSSDLEDA